MKVVPIFIYFGIFLSSLFSVEVQAQEAFESSVSALPTLPAALSDDSQYVLGSGDRLHLSFFNVPEYDGEKQILVDGSVNLPLIGKLSIAGLTLEAAKQRLEFSYSNYLRTPLISIDLVAPRPIKVGVSGEVNRPGAYEISLTDGSNEWPTVVDAIQLSGGITDQANVRHVEIHRFQASPDEQVIQIDFWDVLTTGNIQNDITLRHGDAIYVPTAATLTPEELTQLSAANFSPDSIRVTVVGEVPNPGAVNVPPNAPLNQALLAAGGFDPRRARTDEVELVRLNPDGTVSQRKIAVGFDQGINEDGNPSLRNNDVVLVGRSASTALADDVGGALAPLGVILSPIRLLLNLLD
ncbi:SLBB domain-containing protein [Leptothoe spongobia]|uniref:SLBB domain-containing protein n=1 Tax=Leptothoe spongobia TAU-MAC 1115 TaxID=1967444 RepID=A0A947DEP2_9CYAN|nr:SLBB domain-containing protein [Leptothoe spongobia]MBT9315647.1 SLBB domain-containing protein [Leptothoe spongobia TAU-MAC 1115]